MGEERREEDKEILRPLMRPDCLDERAERMSPLEKGVRGLNAFFTKSCAQGEAGIREHVFRRIREQGKVSDVITDVGEAMPTELTFKGCKLPVPREVRRVVTSKHAFKQPEMTCYSLGQMNIRSSGEVQQAPATPLLLKEVQQRSVVGEMSYIEFNVRGDEGLEGRLSFQKRGRQSKKATRMCPSQRKKGIQQCVGLNKGSVQIDTDRVRTGAFRNWLGHDLWQVLPRVRAPADRA